MHGTEITTVFIWVLCHRHHKYWGAGNEGTSRMIGGRPGWGKDDFAGYNRSHGIFLMQHHTAPNSTNQGKSEFVGSRTVIITLLEITGRAW